MKEILTELNNGSTILMETSTLPEFFDYVSKERDYYGFRFEYIEDMVKITMDYKHTIIKLR
jgi:hypothetical protein